MAQPKFRMGTGPLGAMADWKPDSWVVYCRRMARQAMRETDREFYTKWGDAVEARMRQVEAACKANGTRAAWQTQDPIDVPKG